MNSFPRTIAFLALISLLLIPVQTIAQHMYEQAYATGSGASVLSAVKEVENKNVLIYYEKNDFHFLIKTDSLGNTLWQNRYSFGMDQGVYGISLAYKPGKYVLGGFMMGTGTNSRDGFIIVTDTAGATINTTRIDAGNTSNAIHSITAAPTGFICSGRSSYSAGGGSYDFQLIRLDDNGNQVWAMQFGGTGWDWPLWAEPSSDNGFLIAGYGDGFTATYDDAYIVKTDSSGNKVWSRIISSSNSDEALCVREDGLGYIYVSGRTLGMHTTINNPKGWLTKLTPAGTHLWTKVFPDVWEIPHFLIDGSTIWMTAEVGTGVFGNGDVWLTRIDTAGNYIDTKVYGGPQREAPYSIDMKSDGGLLIGAASFSFSPGLCPYIISTDATGRTTCENGNFITTITTFTPNVLTPVDVTGSTISPFTHGTINSNLFISPIKICCGDSIDVDFQFTPDPVDSVYTWHFNNLSSGFGSYSWSFGDGNVSIQLNPTHTYITPGVYVVSLTMNGICDTVTVNDTIVILNTGVEIEQHPLLFTIHPNPVKDVLTISLFNPGEKEVTLTLFSVDGKMIFTDKILMRDGVGNYHLKMNDHPAGAYVLRLEGTKSIGVKHLISLP